MHQKAKKKCLKKMRKNTHFGEIEKNVQKAKNTFPPGGLGSLLETKIQGEKKLPQNFPALCKGVTLQENGPSHLNRNSPSAGRRPCPGRGLGGFWGQIPAATPLTALPLLTPGVYWLTLEGSGRLHVPSSPSQRLPQPGVNDVKGGSSTPVKTTR